MTSTQTIQPIERCGAVGKCMSHPSSYASYVGSYQRSNPKAIANHALQQLEAARAKDIATHEKNLPAIEANKAIAARVQEFMEEIGMPKSYSERDTKSRARYPRTITHQAGYLGDLQRHCLTDDSFTYATSTYERLKRDYDAYAVQAEAEAEAAARKRQLEAEAVIRKRKADMELAAILLRYQLPIDASWNDVLEALRSKNQRLDLAVAMQQTRGDWSDGPYRVRDALERFAITTTEDKDIANDILDCLRDFCDGRVFRDTTWSYDCLYASVEDEVLRNDCILAFTRASDE